MNQTNTQKTNKFKTFMKKYAYSFLLLLGLIAAMGIVLLSNRASGKEETIDENSLVVVDQNETAGTVDVAKKEEVKFQNPVATSVVVRDYSEEEFVNYVSLGFFATHRAVDFSGEAGTKVFAVAKGKVVSVQTTSNLGTVVVIEHDDGFKSSYASLDSNVNVSVGQTVKMGAQIGTMSNSMLDEAELGVHLHFELFKDGKLVDPNLYLNLSNK